jgi:hypothetical protein
MPEHCRRVDTLRKFGFDVRTHSRPASCMLLTSRIDADLLMHASGTSGGRCLVIKNGLCWAGLTKILRRPLCVHA